jgi:general nucleoside transport system permease protein
MTTVQTRPAPKERDVERASQRRLRFTLYVVAGVVLMSVIRQVTGADDIDSAGTLRAALTAAIPIALAGLGGLWSERAGVVNIGLEGMMIMGTLGAGYFTYHYGVVVGLLGAVAFGALTGVLHAVATVTFGVDHIVSGVAINIIALGAAGFLAETFFSGLEGGGPTQSPSLDRPWDITIPAVRDWALDLQHKDWFLVSDLAGVLGALTDRLNIVTLLAIALVLGTGWLLWKSSFGLRLRSCGESPVAAESLGINVYRYKFVAVTISGAFAGLAGAYLAMVAASGFQQGQTNGRGYIGLAAMIFGNWRPVGLLMGSTIFGYTDGIQLRRGGESLHALLLLVAVLLVIIAVMQLRKQVYLQAAMSAVFAVLFFVWYATTDEVPREFTTMAPYVVTLLVLAFASQQLRMPAADGQTYRKGSAG